jgi:Ca2+-binding RTX toxin-like protein
MAWSGRRLRGVARTASLVLLPALVGIPALATPAEAATTSINWSNRGQASDGFDAVFGAGLDAQRARALVDAAIDQWERVITSMQRPLEAADNTLDITVTAENGDTPTSCGGGASGNYDALGWPADGGSVTISGNEAVWFVDPTPFDHSEFTGGIDNAFSGEPQAGSPAAGLCDMYTVVAAEMMHILGVTSNTASRFQTGLFSTKLTFTGTTCAGPGDLWRFDGPSVTALMTSNNGGPGGSDRTVPVHVAEPCSTFGALSGAEDAGNALFDGGRYIPSNLGTLILKDAYNYAIAMPETFGTFYATLNQSTGELLVRGGDDNNASADTIILNRAGDNLAVSVDIGNDVAGTGPTDAFVSSFPVGEVRSIRVNAFDGDDRITLGSGVDLPVVVDGGAGNDVIYGGTGDDTLNGGTGNDQIYAGGGVNTVTDGTGDDLVDLTQNAAGVTYTTGGGLDTVLGSVFDDVIQGGSSADRLEGRGGNDALRGAGGNDALFGQEGSDTFLWAEGDASDTVEGGAGESDVQEIAGNVAANSYVVGAQTGSRVTVSRPASFTLDLGSIEDLGIAGDDGDDTADVMDLFGTEMRKVRFNPGFGADTLRARGRETSESLEVAAVSPSEVAVGGFVYDLRVVGADAADTFRLDGNGGNDSLLVSGTTGTDALSVAPTALDAATLSGLGSLTVAAATIEQVAVEGRGGNDALTVVTPAGPQDVTLAAGITRDAGSVAIPGLMPVSWGSLGLPGSVEVADAGGVRADRVRYDGTLGGDTFAIGSAVTLNEQSPVTPSGAANLVVAGGIGDDVLNVTSGLPYATTVLDGGDSVQGDRAVLSGAAGAVVLDTATSTVAGYGGTVSLAAIEDLATNQTGGLGTALTVLGTATSDDVAYRPLGAQSGQLSIAGFRAGLTFGGVGGTFLVDPLGGSDKVTVLGTLADDTFYAQTLPLTTVQVNALKTATIPQLTAEKIAALADEGADTFDVTVFDMVAGRLFLFGDQPSSKRFAENVIVRNGSATQVQYRDVKAHTFENGSIFVDYKSTALTTRLDYEGVENLKFYR